MKSHSIVSLFLTLTAIVAIGIYFKLYGKEYFGNEIPTVDLNDPHKALVYQGYAPIGAEALPAAWDSTKNDSRSLFVFANNKSDPQCCFGPNASGYSTSRGCVCLTEQQKQYFTTASLQPKCTST